MTTPRTVERDLPALLEDLYLTGIPDYRDDIVRRTAAKRQRPAWTFLERWIPMDLVLRRPTPGGFTLRPIALLLVALLIAAVAVAAWIGSRPKLAPLLGPAANGPLAYSKDGDIYIRAGLNGQSTLLVGGAGQDDSPSFSSDGSHFNFVRWTAGKPYLMVANADGTGVLQLPIDLGQDATVAWSTTGRSIVVVDHLDTGKSSVNIVPIDGSAPTKVDIGAKLTPLGASMRPPDDRQLLVRAKTPSDAVVLLTVNIDGTNLQRLDVRTPVSIGPRWDLNGATWDPSGQRIAFNSLDKQPSGFEITSFRIHVINADGTGEITLPGPASANAHEAWTHWSPDGTMIMAQRWDGLDGGRSWLGVTPADGSAPGRDVGPVRIDTTRATQAEGEFSQSWSPDGTRILLRYSDSEFYVINPTDGTYETLTWPSADGIPDWQRLAP